MKGRPGVAALAFVTAFAVAIPAAGAVPGPTPTKRARYAVRYLAEQQKRNGSFPGSLSPLGTAADAVVAMVAARRAPSAIDDAVSFLRRGVRAGRDETVGLKAKIVLALVAAGADPRDVAGADLVDEIASSAQPDGRLGAETPLYEHTLALLGLRAAGADVPEDSAAWLAAAQCDDGGWQYNEPVAPTDDEHCVSEVSESDFFASDTNTTALAVQALAYEGAPGVDVDPFTFFAAIRDEDKRGWGYTWSFTLTDANSTALVLGAYQAAGVDPPRGAPRALRRLQYGACSETPGAFAYSWGEDGERTGADVAATVAAIPALVKRPLPVGPVEVTKTPPRPRCRR